MKKIFKALIPFITLPLLAGCNETNGDFFMIDNNKIGDIATRETYKNSFDDEAITNQWESYFIGDPFVYRFNGMYYLYVSTLNFTVGIRAYKSEDLVHWVPCQAQGLDLSYVSMEDCTLSAYAPEVIYRNGKFYMTESQGGKGHYMLEADNPEGPFVKTQDNFGQAIDGSFFIDDDEQVYFLNAGAGGIRMGTMSDDMVISEDIKKIQDANIGGWTEGPYMLKKDGNYYLSFTGTNVTSAGYRVAYAYHGADDEGEMFNKAGFTFGDNLLLNTSDDFQGLGHSSTVLGPNMDSYYIAYHSLESAAGPRRRFCINRLLFNGTEMGVSYYGLNDNLSPQMPEFTNKQENSMVEEGGFVLSNIASKDKFTAEFNFIGENVKNVFSYVDASNYNYITVSASNLVSIKKVVGGNEETIASYQLKKSYDYSKLHTLRVSYSDGVIDGYFDNLNVIKKVNAELVGGKIGYVAASIAKENINYTAFSNAAHDSSQNEDFKQDLVLANTQDLEYSTVTKDNFKVLTDEGTNGIKGSNYLVFSKNKSATYKVLVKEDGYYGIDMTMPVSVCNKKVSIRVDNEEYQEFTAPEIMTDEQDYLANVGGVYLPKGVHYITIKGENGFAFRNFRFFKASTNKCTFENDLSNFITQGAIYVNMWKIKNSGHYALSGNRQLVYFGDESIQDAEVEVTINFDGDTLVNTAGILLRGNNAAFAGSDDGDSIQGFYVGINNSKVFIKECNYNLSTSGRSDVVDLKSGEDIVLKASIKGNTVKAYINGTEVLEYVTVKGVTHGHLGLYTNGCQATFKNLKINVTK